MSSAESFRARAIHLLDNNDGFARTGCTLLDCTLGGGQGLGIPWGRIVNFVGDKSSGKTFLANELVAKNAHTFGKKFRWNHDDAESGYTFDMKAMYGLEVSPDERKSRTVEELDANLYDFQNSCKPGQKGIYIGDSLDGLANADILEREEKRAKGMKKAASEGKVYKDDGSYGMQSQKFLSQEFFRTKAASLMDKEIIMVFISQIRDKINAGMFERKWTRAGGRALDFYAHSVLVLAQVHKIKRDGAVVGVVVRVKLDKSKTPRPYRECDFSLYFDYGIDDVGSSLDYLYDLRGEDFKLKKSAQEIRWNGIEKNIASYKDFLVAENLYETAREQKKAETGKVNLSVEWLDEWVEKNPELSAKVNAHFGRSYTRDELIAATEETDEKGKLTPAAAALRREIEVRVIAKWEEAEYNRSSKRRPKYA